MCDVEEGEVMEETYQIDEYTLIKPKMMKLLTTSCVTNSNSVRNNGHVCCTPFTPLKRLTSNSPQHALKNPKKDIH